MVKLLFSDKQELIRKFNELVPPKYNISLPLSGRTTVNLEGATGLIKRIKVHTDVIKI